MFKGSFPTAGTVSQHTLNCLDLSGFVFFLLWYNYVFVFFSLSVWKTPACWSANPIPLGVKFRWNLKYCSSLTTIMSFIDKAYIAAVGRVPMLLPSGKRRKLQISEIFESSHRRGGWIFPEVFLPQHHNLGFVWLHCDRVLPFFCFLHSHKVSNSLCNETSESRSPVPRRPQKSAEAIQWWVARGQLCSCCGCCLCQLNTVTFDLSFCPLPVTQCITSSTVNFWEKQICLGPLWLDPNCAKKITEEGRFSIYK